MTQTAAVVSEQDILGALRAVRDPELDESVVELEFVDSVRVEDDSVEVVLRLPTFWCAPNFAYLMAHDAHEQVRRVPGVRRVRVALKDHMYGDEIGDGVSDGRPFSQLFEGEADGDDVEQLRRLFQRKAFGMRQEQLVRFLLDAGLAPEDVVGLRLQDVLDTSDQSGLRLRLPSTGEERLVRGGALLARMYLDRRERIGLPTDGRARLVTDAEGAPIAAAELSDYLQRTRRQRVSMVFNSVMCSGLLQTRYGLSKRERQD
jgi:metal-sulfur cluster biosynthetic enzyme